MSAVSGSEVQSTAKGAMSSRPQSCSSASSRKHAAVAHQHLGPVRIERGDHLGHRRQRVQRRRAGRAPACSAAKICLEMCTSSRAAIEIFRVPGRTPQRRSPAAGRGRDREVLDAIGEQAAEAARAGGRADVETAQVAPGGGGLDVRLDAGQAQRRIARDLVPLRHQRGLGERRRSRDVARDTLAVVRRALDRVVDQRAQALVLVGEELIARPVVARHELADECARVDRGGHGATASGPRRGFASGGGSWSFPASCSRAFTPSLR